jgi:hypothetical protein
MFSEPQHVVIPFSGFGPRENTRYETYWSNNERLDYSTVALDADFQCQNCWQHCTVAESFIAQDHVRRAARCPKCRIAVIIDFIRETVATLKTEAAPPPEPAPKPITLVPPIVAESVNVIAPSTPPVPDDDDEDGLTIAAVVTIPPTHQPPPPWFDARFDDGADTWIGLVLDTFDRDVPREYAEYLTSTHFEILKYEMLTGRCSWCNADDGRRTLLHHLDYAQLGCERPEDVVEVCHECHDRHHGYRRAA